MASFVQENNYDNRKNEYLGQIIRTSQLISSILDIEELLHTILDKTMESLGSLCGILEIYQENSTFIEYWMGRSVEAQSRIPADIIALLEQDKKGVVLQGRFSLGLSSPGKRRKKVDAVCIPFLLKEKLLGQLYLETTRSFSEDTLEILGVFTAQAAISIENARLHLKMMEQARIAQEMDIARDIQVSILPTLKDTEHYGIATFMRTATEVGGDFYDLYLKKNPYFGIFGDVAGHGLKSGLIMMMAEVAFCTLMSDDILRQKSLPFLYQKINSLLFENIQERLAKKSNYRYSPMYSTCKMFRFDAEGHFEIFGGDHAEPIFCGNDGTVAPVESRGFLLGIIENAVLDQQAVELKLESGEFLVFYSDGIIEASKAREAGEEKSSTPSLMYGKERLYALIARYRNETPENLIRLIIEDLDAFTPEQNDDITLLVLRKK